MTQKFPNRTKPLPDVSTGIAQESGLTRSSDTNLILIEDMILDLFKVNDVNLLASEIEDSMVCTTE